MIAEGRRVHDPDAHSDSLGATHRFMIFSRRFVTTSRH
ncbi:hypothetical protein FTUN_7526 [Frigoriglobus tundricola]|uniref:Uncharacterized protein n=1 Tax=Frigoriglobus tundricola TaxID=2774151 RepID=A0A6M5Z315_9BACT|nr:hypothetical protein FTUN_7526 [Frigoriglobus tundricola]